MLLIVKPTGLGFEIVMLQFGRELGSNAAE